MARRRKIGILVAALILVSAGYGTWMLLNSGDSSSTDTTLEIIPHPYNELNWWDIPYDIAVEGDLIDPLLRVTGAGNRHIENPNNGYNVAAEYLVDTLSGWGYDADLFGEHEYKSVLAHRDGYDDDNRVIIFGAHLDSDPGGYGVDQNAGGVAVVTMIAELLQHYRLPIDVYFAYYSYNTVFLDDQNEVRAMWGSKEISQFFLDEGFDVIANFNFDQLLFYDRLQPLEESLIGEHNLGSGGLGYQRTLYPIEVVQSFLSQAGYDILTLREDTTTQTDHWSYWQRGLPAINIRSGHTPDPEMPPTDAVYSQNYNRTHAVELAKACAATVVYLGLQGNGNDASFKIDTELLAGESVTIKPTMSISQLLQIEGNTNSTNGLSLWIRNSENDYILPVTDISDTNFSITSNVNSGLGRVTLTVQNSGNTTSDIEIYLLYECDTDGNGVPDSEQYTWNDPVPFLDWDGDGLSDSEEVTVGTDIFITDTDMDTMNDGYEVAFGLNPLIQDDNDDLDQDELSNAREMSLGTFPNSTDTDQDGMDDFWEVLYLTNPLVNDSQDDFDNDSLTNIEEYLYGADPRSSDGDFDGVPDAEEVSRGMNALSDDSDNDGLRDQLELIEGLNPLVPDYDIDLSPDGPDHNPRINSILIIVAIALVPVIIGTIYFGRKLK
ncbi:MAG: M28 family peptidase [Candidatus Thorarchaeota archaeon]